MKLSAEMLQAAMEKTIESGILLRRSQIEDLPTNAGLRREILEAALSQSAPQPGSDSDCRS